MSDGAAGSSRFAPPNQTSHDRLANTTVGLVALSDFRKRRAEALEQQQREAREAAAAAGTPTPDRSQTATPDVAASDSASPAPAAPPRKKARKTTKKRAKLLSFDDDGSQDDDDGGSGGDGSKDGAAPPSDAPATRPRAGLKANAAVAVVPKPATKSALRREAAEREALRREFLQLQEAVKATEIAIPFVFYDGANTPGGTVRMKKGDPVWLFLDKGRKVGAGLGVGDQSTPRKSWARVGVDDLLLVRDTVIIPHHYDFYFFVMNKTLGPGGRRLFDYRNEAPSTTTTTTTPDAPASPPEGASDDPAATKVVDRRWYERNKHIYPASTWQHFDPEKDYAGEIRKDTGGNTFFYSK